MNGGKGGLRVLVNFVAWRRLDTSSVHTYINFIYTRRMMKAKRLWGHVFSYVIKLIRNLINGLKLLNTKISCKYCCNILKSWKCSKSWLLKSTVEADSTLKVNSVKSLILLNLELIVLLAQNNIRVFWCDCIQRTAPLKLIDCCKWQDVNLGTIVLSVPLNAYQDTLLLMMLVHSCFGNKPL